MEQAKLNPDCHLIDSKDAKTIIPGSIQLVQLPGKSLKKISHEDHF